MLECKLCDFKTESQISLSKHTSFHHKLKFPEYLIQTKYNGIKPTCLCGCGEETRYKGGDADFGRYKRGHQSRNEGHWGDLKSEKRVNKIIATRKAKFNSGEYDYIKDAIKEARKDPELGGKISKGAKGVPKPKPEGFGVGRKHSQKTKDKMRDIAIDNIVKTGKVKRSNLEYKFEGLLQLENIKYIHSFYIKRPGFNKIYDFYLPNCNTLIEVDGDFWHCNPNTKFKLPEYKSQEINIINDEIKNNWALDNGYKLLRFWESDINNNILEVKRILLEHIKTNIL
jgi:very-short-patch-repair endonuclease